ncbi:MAG: hypothetical protein AAF394_17230, partial [Planctomycetota bacterium]
CKLALLGLILTAASFFVNGQVGSVLQAVGLAIAVPLGIAGALVCGYMLVKERTACPLCSQQGDFVMYGNHPSIECEQCGMVYCQNIWFSLKLCTDPLEQPDVGE